MVVEGQGFIKVYKHTEGGGVRQTGNQPAHSKILKLLNTKLDV